MITNLEERSSYDTSNFLADMGGSLGFLLGLSVIGFIIVLEKILGYLFLDKLVEDYKQRNEKKTCPKESKVMEANWVIHNSLLFIKLSPTINILNIILCVRIQKKNLFFHLQQNLRFVDLAFFSNVLSLSLSLSLSFKNFLKKNLSYIFHLTAKNRMNLSSNICYILKYLFQCYF